MSSNTKARWWNGLGYRTRELSTSEVVKTWTTIDHKAYVFYRENSELCSRKLVKDYVEYGKLISEFYRVVSDELVDSKGGVYIKDFGYFGIMKYFFSAKTSPRQDPDTGIWVKKLNTEEDYFFTAFVPISKNNRLRLFSFDCSYTQNFKDKLTAKLRAGYRYTFNASLFYTDLKKAGAKT